MDLQTAGERVAAEFAGIHLGNTLRVARAQATAAALVAGAGVSLPQALTASGALQGAYRLMRSPAVQPEALLEGHLRASATRAAARPVTLCLHDTTEMRFGGKAPRAGTGPLTEGGHGFFAHVALAVTPAGQPLGLLHLFAWHRPIVPAGTPPAPKKKKLSQSLKSYVPDRESQRWIDGVEAAEARVADPASLVHIMDREGDAFERLAELDARASRFVIRMCHDRRLDASRKAVDVAKAYDVLAAAPLQCTREVWFSDRRATSRQTERTTRVARLEVRARAFVISPANGAVAHVPQRLALNIVEVREVDPPAGEDPILWRLLTTEPIATPADVLQIVDWYRRRWTIEEFFKALKTGCGYEDLQLCSGHALLNALALLVPVAWVLLEWRWLARAAPDTPAATRLTPTQLALVCAKAPATARVTPATLSLARALEIIAALGGHLRHNGPPGWLTLVRGYRVLLQMEEAVALLAPTDHLAKPDQS